MRVVIGHSEEIDSSEAVQEVLESCGAQLGGDTPKAAILFMSVDYDHQTVLDQIADRWPGLPLIGATTDGELSSASGFYPDSVLLTLLCGEGLEARAGLGRDLSQGIERSVEDATSCLNGDQPALCITVPHPTTVNISEVIRALDRRLEDRGCPVVGGLAGDHREFARTLQFFHREVLEDAAPMLFLVGDVKVSCGIGSGWFPIGSSYEITRSEGNVVHEIDGQPALEVYSQRWGLAEAGGLEEFPLAVYAEELEGDFYLRAVVSSDPEAGSVVFAGDVPQGSTVRMTEVLPDGLLSGSSHSLRQATASYPGSSPELALVFSCAARKWVLGTQVEKEIGMLRDALTQEGAEDLALSGFYCYGEIAPLKHGGESQLLNETCVTVLIGR